MNPKDMTDIQLNEAVAWILDNLRCDYGESCTKDMCDSWDGGKCPDAVAHDYCNSPKAGAELKQWLDAKPEIDWQIRSTVGRDGREYWAEIFYNRDAMEIETADRELRALAEAFVMAFGKE